MFSIDPPCQVKLDSNHLENFMEFLGVEMLKIRDSCPLFCVMWAATDVFLNQADAAAARKC